MQSKQEEEFQASIMSGLTSDSANTSKKNINVRANGDKEKH